MEADAVLKMEVIAEHIFNFLSVEDLKRARLVCRVWSLEGARKILFKSYFRVPLRFHKEKSLKEIKEEKKLIFNFLHPKKLEDGALKTRSRKVPNVWITRVKDVQILFDLGVSSGNVETLRFPKFCQAGTNQENKKIRLLFKNVMSSKSTSLTAFYFSEATPALTRDTPIRFDHIEQFSEFGKGHLIKSLSFNFSESQCQEEIESYENFLETTPHLALECIIFGTGLNQLRQKQPALFSRAINILNKVFLCSATSLKKLQVTGTLGEVNELEIPILQNLTTLNVVLPPKNQNSRLFPKMAEHFCFPNLSKVTIGILGTDWIGRRRFQEISLQHAEKLLPGLNPELKFSVYEFNDFGHGKNQLLVCPPNSIPEQTAIDLMSRQVIRESNEERESMYDNICWWFECGLTFLACFFFIVMVGACILAYFENVSLQKILVKKLGEMNRQIHNQVSEIGNMVHGLDLHPRTACIGEGYTWKIPQIFACPKNIMDEETTTASFNTISTWAHNLQQFTCQQAATFSNELKALQLF